MGKATGQQLPGEKLIQMKRLLGMFFLLLSLAGLSLSVVAVFFGHQIVDEIGASLSQTLTQTADSLDTIHETLLLTKETSAELDQSLRSVGETTGNVSQTVGDTGPLLDQVTAVVTNDVPGSIEAVQTAIPDVAEAAGAIDDTLGVLNAFQAERRIFGIPISFDLGIDYNPARPLGVTVLQLNASLADMPDNLRGLEKNLVTARENLQTVSDNLEDMAVRLGHLRESVAAIDPLLDYYIELTGETGQQLRQTQADLGESVKTAKQAITILLVWIALNQIVPLYLGWDLLRGQKRAAYEKANGNSLGRNG